MAILVSLNILFKKHITMKKLIFSFIVVATAILVSCNEEFEENKERYKAGLLKLLYTQLSTVQFIFWFLSIKIASF